ncbi:MAG: TonB-dependent receptor plug domain-containing protein [Rhodanobacteraceae bacterium]
MSKNSLREAIRNILYMSGMTGAALGLGGIAGTVHAQQAATPAATQQPQTLQTIVVTGSHIRRVDIETSNPVVVVTAQQIQATGKLTLGGIIQSIPAITGGVSNPSVNNGGGSGATLVGLRGLGASRTLVLVDGQRVVGFNPVGSTVGTNTSVDLNSIPAAAVERIEVLTDGASAIYGSDAIGGVINIILKSNYQGAQFSLNYGISDHDDGERQGASFMFGQTSDKGSILAGVSYNQFDEIEMSARKFSENALSLTNSSGQAPLHSVVGGSSSAARDYIIIPASASCPSGALSLNPGVATAGTSPTTPADYHCFSKAAGDAYNYAAVNLLLIPQQRTTGFFKGVYHLTSNIDAFATFWHTKTTSGFQIAPGVIGTDTTATSISADSYYNPFGVALTPSNGNTYRGRLFPAGNRMTSQTSTNDQLQAGLRGNLTLFGQDWTWDVGFNYGHISDLYTAFGLVNLSAVAAGLGPSFLNAQGVVQCGTPATPISLSQCTPWDPFNLYSPSAKAVLSSNSAPSIANSWYIARTEHADVSGGLLDLPAGTVQLAAGVSHNSQYANNTVGPLLLISGPPLYTCALGSQCAAHTQGGYSVKEAYAEAFIPVLKDVPFIGALNVTLGERYSKYSDVGSTNNWKFAMEWRPISDLLVRGTVTSVFRAPTITDLFAPPSSSAPFLDSDPCDFVAPTPTTRNPNAGNPACVGVPATGTFIDNNVALATQVNAITTGSNYAGVSLKPELGKSFDFGAVYSPHYVPGLSLSADVWRVYLNNTITSVGAQTILNLCFAGITFYCPFMSRNTTGASAGQPKEFIQPYANLGRIDVRGIDVSGQYKLPAFSFGQFNLGLNATYLQSYTIQTAPGKPGNEVLNAAGMFGNTGSSLAASCPFSIGSMCFLPRIRAQGTLGWQLGPWDAQWTMQYISKFKMGSADLSQGATSFSGIPGLVFHYGATVYNNVEVGYNIQPINTRIEVGIDNVMDKQPPMLFANNVIGANTDAQDFDVIGRYYWARLTVNF